MSPMAEAARRLATWDDILRQPDGETWEVIGGELELMTRPRPAHNLAQARLSSEVVSPFDRGRGGPGGWWILIEPDVRLSEHDIVAPDLVGYRRERLPRLPEERPFDVAPDWVCEILSPSTHWRDRGRKSDLYRRAGVPHLWLLDPQERTLEAFEARPEGWLRLGIWSDGDTPRIPPFEAIELDVAGLLPPLE